jgi:hypothetical protein
MEYLAFLLPGIRSLGKHNLLVVLQTLGLFLLLFFL